VCTVKRVLPGGAADCGAADRPSLHFVQEQIPPNRPDIERELLRYERLLNEYWAAAQARRGRQHARPQVDIQAPSGQPGPTTSWMAPLLPPAIELSVEDGGDPEGELADAVLQLAHLFARAGQRGLTPPATTDEAFRARVLLADCMAGAFAGWARSRGLMDARTAARMVELMLGYTGGARYPDVQSRQQSFREGLRNGLKIADPLDACIPSS
jgi:hypothetical protein